LQIATTRGLYFDGHIEEGRVGEQFYVTARVKDYWATSGGGAAVKFAYTRMSNPLDKLEHEHRHGSIRQAKIDLGKTQELLFPGMAIGNQSLFPAVIERDRYPAVDSSSTMSHMRRERRLFNLSVNAPLRHLLRHLTELCDHQRGSQPISGQMTGEMDEAKAGGISLRWARLPGQHMPISLL